MARRAQAVSDRIDDALKALDDSLWEPVVYHVPAALSGYVITHDYLENKSRKQDARLWQEKALVLLWAAIGRRQHTISKSNDTPLSDVFVNVMSTGKVAYGLKKLFGNDYLEHWLTPFQKDKSLRCDHKYSNSKTSTSGEGKALGYQLDPSLFEGEWVEWKITNKGFLKNLRNAREAFFQSQLDELANDVPALIHFLTAFEITTASHSLDAMPADLFKHESVARLKMAKVNDFHFLYRSKDDPTNRSYSNLTTLKTEAKGHLLMPNGEGIVQFDWGQHHLTIWAARANDRQLLGFARDNDVYQAAAEWAKEQRGWKWLPDTYASHAKMKNGDRIDSERQCMKKFCNALLSGSKSTNSFAKFLEKSFPTTFRVVEEAKRNRTCEPYEIAYQVEHEVRTYLLDQLVSRGVDYFLDDHDGFSVGRSDTDAAKEAVAVTNQKFFNGLAKEKWLIDGSEINSLHLCNHYLEQEDEVELDDLQTDP